MSHGNQSQPKPAVSSAQAAAVVHSAIILAKDSPVTVGVSAAKASGREFIFPSGMKVTRTTDAKGDTLVVTGSSGNSVNVLASEVLALKDAMHNGRSVEKFGLTPKEQWCVLYDKRGKQFWESKIERLFSMFYSTYIDHQYFSRDILLGAVGDTSVSSQDFLELFNNLKKKLEGDIPLLEVFLSKLLHVAIVLKQYNKAKEVLRIVDTVERAVINHAQNLVDGNEATVVEILQAVSNKTQEEVMLLQLISQHSKTVQKVFPSTVPPPQNRCRWSSCVIS